MSKKLVIVESPTKAKTIRKYLPKEFIVEASFGHVRDLPQSASDIPAKLKKEEWAKLGVDVENDFAPLYVVPKGKSKIITQLRKLLKDCDELYLATDEDREGESISWHLIELLKPKVPVKRMVFHEITKAAIQDALKNCREIDTRLVSAQETRRVLDRLVGYTLSPLIWKKIAFGLSAGRVQSAGVRLLVERERERMAFKKSQYWNIRAELAKDAKGFEAKMSRYDAQKVAVGKDFDPLTGELAKASGSILHLKENQAQDIARDLKNQTWQVASVEEKNITSRPSPPFITSTLQQEANRKLGMSARQAMRTAQRLYEQGLITYMRTDSPYLSQEAIAGARSSIEKLYGKTFLSEKVRQFSSKSKSAQEAHEAIRPAGNEFKHPDDIGLSGEEFKLYSLIWKRTLASQMAEARKKSVSATIQAGKAEFRASGMYIEFPGFIRAYVEGKDDPDQALEDKETFLPEMKAGEKLNVKNIIPESHETKAVARYTEASLVQKLEKEGIGRPSTYASIITTILDRNYARKLGNALVPTFTGLIVVQLLEKHFSDLVDYQFTSVMEDTLDEIAEGKREAIPYLNSFYLGKKGLKTQVDQKQEEIDPKESRQITLLQPVENVELRVGRFGPFLVKQTPKGEDDIHSSIPEDIAPSDLTKVMIEDIIQTSLKGPEAIGIHPDTGEKIYVLLGRYGPYVQLGEVSDANPKPKRASVSKELDYRNLALEDAVKLLKVPYEIGKHPETQQSIMANVGRFGPYIQCGEDTRSLKKEDDVYDLSLERAIELLSQEKKGRRGPAVLKDFGNHPKTKKKFALMDGKYGIYLKHGTKNIRIPEDIKAEDLTPEKAIELVNNA